MGFAAELLQKYNPEETCQNTSRAEQGNSNLKRMKTTAVFMRQDTVMWLLRLVLYLDAVRKHGY
jgi:hypothetical protein